MASTVTIQQLVNSGLDTEAIGRVTMADGFVGDATTNRDNVPIDTLEGRLKKLGYDVPILYTGGIVYAANDRTKTVDELGIIYAPRPSFLPFTTDGTFSNDAAKFFVAQGSKQAVAVSLDTLKADTTIPVDTGIGLISSEYNTGSGVGGGLYEKVSADPGNNLINPATTDGNWLLFLFSGSLDMYQAGAIQDGVNDDTLSFVEALAYIDSKGGDLICSGAMVINRATGRPVFSGLNAVRILGYDCNLLFDSGFNSGDAFGSADNLACIDMTGAEGSADLYVQGFNVDFQGSLSIFLYSTVIYQNKGWASGGSPSNPIVDQENYTHNRGTLHYQGNHCINGAGCAFFMSSVPVVAIDSSADGVTNTIDEAVFSARNTTGVSYIRLKASDWENKAFSTAFTKDVVYQALRTNAKIDASSMSFYMGHFTAGATMTDLVELDLIEIGFGLKISYYAADVTVNHVRVAGSVFGCFAQGVKNVIMNDVICNSPHNGLFLGVHTVYGVQECIDVVINDSSSVSQETCDSGTDYGSTFGDVQDLTLNNVLVDGAGAIIIQCQKMQGSLKVVDSGVGSLRQALRLDFPKDNFDYTLDLDMRCPNRTASAVRFDGRANTSLNTFDLTTRGVSGVGNTGVAPFIAIVNLPDLILSYRGNLTNMTTSLQEMSLGDDLNAAAIGLSISTNNQIGAGRPDIVRNKGVIYFFDVNIGKAIYQVDQNAWVDAQGVAV